ncbi:hypothetical protein LguiA_008129 [Lonicera macranthoides]
MCIEKFTTFSFIFRSKKIFNTAIKIYNDKLFTKQMNENHKKERAKTIQL